MKKYFLIALLMLGLAGITDLSAQHHHYHNDKECRKEMKMEKKDSKIHKKMFRDRPRAAARKEYKSRKKEYKMHHSNRYYYKD